jgi:hypothetical protein
LTAAHPPRTAEGNAGGDGEFSPRTRRLRPATHESDAGPARRSDIKEAESVTPKMKQSRTYPPWIRVLAGLVLLAVVGTMAVIPAQARGLAASLSARPAAAASTPPGGQQLPSSGQLPQGQAPQSGASLSTPAGSGFPWMTLAIVLSAAFFAYNLYRYQRLKALERERSDGAVPPDYAELAASTQGARRQAASSRRRQVSAHADADHVADELKALGDQRARGELSRDEYVARKKQLQAGKRSGQLTN